VVLHRQTVFKWKNKHTVAGDIRMSGHENDPSLPETAYVAPPITITASGRSTSTIYAIWGYQTGGGHTGSRVRWGVVGGAMLGEFDIPITSLTCTVSGLNPNTEYLIQVFGLKAGEVSPISRDAHTKTHPATSLPASPTNLSATPTKNTMALSWSGATDASSYKISYGLAPNGAVIGTATSVAAAHTVSGLSTGTHYYFDVRSSNNVGDSSPTRILKQTLQVPAAPVGLFATPSISTMELQWSAATGANDYVIRYGVEPGGAVTTLTTRLLRETLANLNKNTLYFVDASARNANGESSPSRITQRTLDGPPLPPKPGPLVVRDSFDTVRVSWSTINQPGYEVAYGLLSQYPQVIARYETEHLTWLLRYLLPDVNYFIEVRAFNATGYSAPSYATVTIGPDRTQPRNLSNPGRTFNEARLTWDAPVDTSYLIDYEVTCPGRPVVRTSSREHIATGLVPETAYLFKVQPVRREGPCPALSASISVVTHDQVPPARPQGLKFTHTTPGNAVLSWHASEDNVGVTGYEVRRNEEGWVSIKDTCYPISGLLDGAHETFLVRAKDAASNDSRPSSIRTPKLIAPSQPGTPELRDLGHASVTLYWTPSTHQWGTIRYRVYLNEILVMLVDEPVATLVHLQSHTDYRVDVRAFNAAGVSEPAVIRFKTRMRAPTRLRFSQRNGHCRLGWDPVFKKFPAHDISINGQVFSTSPGHWGYNFKLADVSSGPAPHHLKFTAHARLDGDISDIALLEVTVADDVPPSPPERPRVSDITDNGATLNWVPSSDSVGVTGYEVVLNGLLVFQTQDTRFIFSQLTSGAYHWVFVRARDKQGNVSAGSRPIAFKTTGQAPSPRPSAPVASITALTSTSAQLDWEYEDDIPDSGVRILINEEHFRDVLLLNRIVLNDLIPNTEYSISVSKFDVYGQLSEPTMLIFEPRDFTPPSLPGEPRIVEMTSDSVTLSWEGSTDDIGFYEYVIYNNHDYFDSTSLTRYTAVDLLPGTYSFEVCAMDLSGNASEPVTVTVTIQGSQSGAAAGCDLLIFNPSRQPHSPD
jgi:chitodextrinase